MTETIARPTRARPSAPQGRTHAPPSGDLLDALGLAAVSLAPDGRPLHRNRRAAALERADADAREIRRASEYFARLWEPTYGVTCLGTLEIRLGGTAWRARGIAMRGDDGQGTLLLVVDSDPSVGPPDAPTFPLLTPRERWVAQLLAGGYSNKQIAATLAIRPSTAKNHTRNVLRKLGVRRRSQVGVLVRGRPPP